MSDTPTPIPVPDAAFEPVMRTYWFRRDDGEIQSLSSTGEPGDVTFPSGWTLLPDEEGSRLWWEQETHRAEMHAQAVAEAMSEVNQRDVKRFALLERITTMLNDAGGDDDEPLTVEDVADTLGVPVPGQVQLAAFPTPMVDFVDPHARGGGPDNVGL